MTRRRWIWTATAVAVTVTATMTAAVAVDAGTERAAAKVKACAHKRTGELRLAPSCKRGEKRVTWARTGPAGRPGPAGPSGARGAPGALRTTPVNVRYESTRSTPHELRVVGGAQINLDCGTNRIGAGMADLSIFAEEIHGTSTSTRYKDASVVDASTTYAINERDVADLDGVGAGVGATHATANVTAIVTMGGVVSQVAMYVKRDTRAGRPACEFIGSVTELGPATVMPS